MPIPETPNTREEMYLNAMATGDSGGIPPVPYTRQEMYLDAIARNGGGGGGSGGGVLVVNSVYDESTDTETLNQTWQEIHDAPLAVLSFENDAGKAIAVCTQANRVVNGFFAAFYTVQPDEQGGGTVGTLIYSCASATDYPVMHFSD